jgi:TetR/AcrR family transcriptional repressor of mexJK operon
VIQAARRVFLEQGFDAASLDLIAREAGVHRDTLYRQYGSKEILFRTALWSLMGPLRDGVARAIGRGGPPDQVLPRVARQLHADVTAPDSIGGIRTVVAVSGRFPELGELSHDNWKADLAPLIDYLETQRTAGVLRMDDAAEAAYAFANAAASTLRALLAAPLGAAALEAHLKRTVALHLAGWHYRPGPDIDGAAAPASTKRRSRAR